MKIAFTVPDQEIKDEIKDALREEIQNIILKELSNEKVVREIMFFVQKNLSPEKIDNMARDRISRIIIADSLKEFTNNITDSEVLANVESKILLMIQNSKEFKKLVISVLKDSL